jgi:hypothetical protein
MRIGEVCTRVMWEHLREESLRRRRRRRDYNIKMNLQEVDWGMDWNWHITRRGGGLLLMW